MSACLSLSTSEKLKRVYPYSTILSSLHLQAKASEDPSVADEIIKLRKQNKELLKENEELKSKTTELHLQIGDLMDMLSRKEAEWCSKEEKLKVEVTYSSATYFSEICNVFEFVIPQNPTHKPWAYTNS